MHRPPSSAPVSMMGMSVLGQRLNAAAVSGIFMAPHLYGAKNRRPSSTRCARRLSLAANPFALAKLDVVNGWLSLDGTLLHPLWLRQRCRAPSHVQHTTRQRLFELTDLGKCKVSAVQPSGDQVKVHFSDGHVSHFEIRELVEESKISAENCTNDIQPSMWSGNDSDISRFEFSAQDLVQVANDNTLSPRERGIADLATHMVKYGLAVVRGGNDIFPAFVSCL